MCQHCPLLLIHSLCANWLQCIYSFTDPAASFPSLATRHHQNQNAESLYSSFPNEFIHFVCLLNEFPFARVLPTWMSAREIIQASQTSLTLAEFLWTWNASSSGKRRGISSFCKTTLFYFQCSLRISLQMAHLRSKVKLGVLY